MCGLALLGARIDSSQLQQKFAELLPSLATDRRWQTTGKRGRLSIVFSIVFSDMFSMIFCYVLSLLSVMCSACFFQ
jgi:hypothetical protein